MQVDQVSFKRKVSFGSYNNEEFGIVIAVGDSDEWNKAMDSARVLVSEALKRSQIEREWQEEIDRTKFNIARCQGEVEKRRRWVDEADEKEMTFYEDDLSTAWNKLTLQERRLALLIEVGPVEGWQERVKEEEVEIEREQAADEDDEDNDYSDDPHDDNWYDTGE